MNPRIRIVAVVLAFAFLVVPAQASASAFSLPSCVSSSPFGADPLLDTIDVDPAWRTSDMTIPSTSLPAGVVGWEWSTDCGTTVNPALPGGDATVSGEGIHRFSHRVQDSGGLWTEWVDHLVRIDLSDPVNTSSTPTGWSRGPLAVNVTGTDLLSGIALAEWRDGPAGAFTAGAVATVGATTGIHQLHTRVTDAVGHTHERTHSVQIDNTAPVDDTDPPDGWQHQVTDVSIEGTDVDSGVGHVEWELDGIRDTGDTGDTVSIGHGIHELKTRIIDAVGNATSWVTHDPIQVDIAGPVDTTTVPSGWVTDGNEVVVNVTGTDSTGVGVVQAEWKLTNTLTGTVQSGNVASPDPVVPVTVSGDGVHKLETRLTDGVGDNSGWRTQYVRIDTILPIDTTNAVSGWGNQAVNVTVGGTDAHSGVERVEWNLNGTPGSFVGSSRVVPVATDGVNTLKTRIIDRAGKASEWKTHTIRIDLTIPVNLTAAAPTGWLKDPYVVTLNGSDAGSKINVIRWRVGTGSVYEESSGTPITIATTGVHTLYTWAVDMVGNMSAERAETVRIDLVKPTDATVYPGGPIPRGRRITFAPTDADSGVAALEWTVNGAPRTGSSVVFGKAGTYTLATRVRDNAGNVSDWTTRTIAVSDATDDTTAPVDTTAAPTGWKRGPYSLAVTAEDAGTAVETVEWRGDQEGAGPVGSTVQFATEGVHHIETRAIDEIGNESTWHAHVVKIDLTNPQDTTAIPTGWTNSRTVTLSARDATSKTATIEYTVNGSAVTPAALAVDPDDADKVTASFPLPADGKYKVAHRVIDGSDRISAWKTDDVWVDTVLPTNTSAAAPTTWQKGALSLALTGTDADSKVDHAEWRVDEGEVHTGSPALVETEGVQKLETRIVDKAGNASVWRPETIQVDKTKPVNTTPLPGAAWRKTNYAVTVSGTDATPGSGVARIEYKLDNGSITMTPAVSITAAGTHKLESRVVDHAGNESDWRVDTIGIDKTNPTLSVNCGGDAWRKAAVACNVTADGGESGVTALTASQGGATKDVVGGTFTVDTHGASAVTFKAVDGAGNEGQTTTTVKIDRSAPVAVVSCTPGAGLIYICKGGGADDLSGIATVTWSVNGSAATPLTGDGSFTVTKGTVVVTSVDAAGNVTTSAPVTLAERKPPPPAHEEDETETVARTSSDAVMLRRSTNGSRLIGQLAISATPSATIVDLRPLALGSGTFQITIKVTAGKKPKTVRKTVKTRKGYSSRIVVKAAAAAHAKAELTIKRKSGKRWVTHASGSAELE